MSETLVLLTGNLHVRVSDLAGRNVRYRAALEPTALGVRMSRKEFARAAEARAYAVAALDRLYAKKIVEGKLEIGVDVAAKTSSITRYLILDGQKRVVGEGVR